MLILSYRIYILKPRTNFVSSSNCYNYYIIYVLQKKNTFTNRLLESFVLYIERLEEDGFTERNPLSHSEGNGG
jgi:hypothetical protein